MDLHKTQFTVCYLHKNGEYKIEVFKVGIKGIEAFKKALSKGDEIAVESTGNTGYFAREIKAVRIINPTQFKIISASVKKTDEHDAVTIARYLSKGLIPEVRMRTKEESQIASLIGTRDKFVKLRTCLKNKIHNILNANGIVTRREIFASEKGLDKVLALDIEASYQFELRVIVEQIRSLNKSIDEIDKELIEKGKKLDGHKSITSLSGIGDISATILLNTIGDVHDFADDKKIAAYIGIVPRKEILF